MTTDPTEPLYCPECDQTAPRRIEQRQETHTARNGVTVTVPAEVAVCCACGHDVWDGELDDATLARVYAAAGVEVAP